MPHLIQDTENMRQLGGSNNNNNNNNGDDYDCSLQPPPNTSNSSGKNTSTKQKLSTYNLEDAVRLPEGEDPNEWQAVNAFDFFNQVSMLYGTIAEYCTDKTCPIMSAGPNHIYQWIDVEGSRRPIGYTAKQYINHLMNWVEQKLADEKLFPCKYDVNFPDNFYQECKIIFKRLFRVFAHVYQNHLENVRSLNIEAHVNTSFKHFIYFVQEFKLIEERELTPLKNLISKFEKPQ